METLLGKSTEMKSYNGVVVDSSMDMGLVSANSKVFKTFANAVVFEYNKILGGKYTSKSKGLTASLKKQIRKAVTKTHLCNLKKWIEYFEDIRDNRCFLWTSSNFVYGDVCKYPTTISKLCLTEFITKIKQNPMLYVSREKLKTSQNDLDKLSYIEREL